MAGSKEEKTGNARIRGDSAWRCGSRRMVVGDAEDRATSLRMAGSREYGNPRVGGPPVAAHA